MRRAWLALLLVAAGCRPDFGAPLSSLTSPRVVAVRLEPPEAGPGASVMARALVATPSGTMMPPLAWSLCRTPKPPTENDVVDPGCLQPDGTQPLATTPLPLAVKLPLDGCRLFGPDAPPSMAGAPPPAPRAPDATGGYYQPLRVDLDGDATIALARIRCALAGASQQTAAEYLATYADNTNPTLTPLSASLDGQPLALTAIPRGRAVTLSVGWTAPSRESFPVLDPLSQALITHHEALTVSWIATAGNFALEHTGRGEDDPGVSVTDTWTAPSAPGPVHVFIVLRDSRGGVDFAAYDLTVQ